MARSRTSASGDTKISNGPRGRRSGRTALQEKQNQESRQKLLDAAREMFAEKTYSVTTIDDILGRADVGRTTFYRHFDSKVSVVLGLYDQFMPELYNYWEQLALCDDPSEEWVIAWLHSVLKFQKANWAFIRTLREVDAIEAAVSHDITEGMYKKVFSRICTRLSPDGIPKDLKKEIKIAAQLLIIQFSEFCYSVAVRNILDEKVGSKLMAQQFLRFFRYVRSPRR